MVRIKNERRQYLSQLFRRSDIWLDNYSDILVLILLSGSCEDYMAITKKDIEEFINDTATHISIAKSNYRDDPEIITLKKRLEIFIFAIKVIETLEFYADDSVKFNNSKQNDLGVVWDVTTITDGALRRELDGCKRARETLKELCEA
jgi:hypothetical protein